MFDEAEAEAMLALVGDETLIAPELLDYELANVCRTKIRKFPEQKPALLASFHRLRRLDIDLHRIDAGQVLDLSLQLGLTPYDASYLWLARSLGVALVTLDQRLARAAAGP